MASHSYMTITGKKMGLISAGCSTQGSIGSRCQQGHADQILVLALNHAMTSISNVSHALKNAQIVGLTLDISDVLMVGDALLPAN